jgi:hypothetical protein
LADKNISGKHDKAGLIVNGLARGKENKRVFLGPDIGDKEHGDIKPQIKDWGTVQQANLFLDKWLAEAPSAYQESNGPVQHVESDAAFIGPILAWLTNPTIGTRNGEKAIGVMTPELRQYNTG